MRKIIQNRTLLLKQRFGFSTVPQWATCDPFTVSEKNPHTVQNLVNGTWKNTEKYDTILDPINGEKFMKVAQCNDTELDEFIQSSKQCPKSGLHNPFKNPERYLMYGDICFKLAAEMRKPEVETYLTKLTQRVMPKSWEQVRAEVVVTRKFLENFTGDNVRWLFDSTQVPGDHMGQRSNSYRWPFGNVALITPFNFPIEIPALQLMGALMAGNRPVLKCTTKMAVVMEQFIRMGQAMGIPMKDIDFINCSDQAADKLVDKCDFRVIQFTGSSRVAEHLSKKTNGKVRIEDAGFDWKVLGPDVSNVDYVAWQSDQDAYAASGQKCSAQSMCYVHKNWKEAGFIEKIKELASRRKLEDLTVGPVITWNNKQIKQHIDNVLKVPGAKVLFGGKPLQNHQIPDCYGAYEPTAIYVPIDQINNHFDVVTTELFGPFQIITEYDASQHDLVLGHLERHSHHLTAGIVSNDELFIEKFLGNTVNGVTYTGLRGRTTGAPQNHFFGPCGDPRGAGIGTKEAIKMVWSHQREIVMDYGPIPNGWKTPKAT